MSGIPWLWPPPPAPPLPYAGEVLQVVQTIASTPANTGVTIPYDNSIPQITEGAAYAPLNTTIIALRDSSILLVQVTISMVSLDNGHLIAALFRDGAANAVGSAVVHCEAANRERPIVLSASVPANGTGASAFSVRYGPDVAGTAYVLSTNALAAVLGGTLHALLTVTEIAQ